VSLLEELLRRHHTLLRSNADVWTKFNLTAAAYYLVDLDDKARSREHLRAALRAKPLSWSLWRYLLASFLPASVVSGAARPKKQPSS